MKVRVRVGVRVRARVLADLHVEREQSGLALGDLLAERVGLRLGEGALGHLVRLRARARVRVRVSVRVRVKVRIRVPPPSRVLEDCR